MTAKNRKKMKLKRRKNPKAVRISMKSVERGARCLWKIGFKKKKVLRLEKKNDGVMDHKSGEDDTGEVR